MSPELIRALLPLIPLFPAVAFVVIILARPVRDNKPVASGLAILAVASATAIAWTVVFATVGTDLSVRPIILTIPWIPTGTTIEGLGAQLDPDFQLMTFAAPYFRRFWLRQRSPDRVARRLAQGVLDLVDLGPELPQALRRLAAQLERGEITVTSRHEGLGEALATLNRAANRLAMSILTAALIIGLALLMLVYHPPGWETWGGWFFGLAFLLAVALGLWLLWSIWHAR
ncbi:MAG: hypothetical protein M5U01_37805 [Ardenticatenaceae bacterium]|nr:hypothetical protein [Ardenticatenaceae bacterium]HBY95712.1 hypothetical protein [Chloroflexota bacterium]